jgi:Cu-Zn family superoxide dismutase
MKGICILRNHERRDQGVVRFTQKGYTLLIQGKVWDVKPGEHGFHIHKNGNEVDGAHTLCEHYNPRKKNHGGLVDSESHAGDLGNFLVGEDGIGYFKEATEKITLEEILGRSMVFHADRDDLGRGGFEDSLKTGHSGDRILYGIIGRDEGGCA